MTSLEIYLLVAPLLAMAVGLTVFGLTSWLDWREQRQKAR